MFVKQLNSILNSDDKKRLAGNFLSLIVLRGFQFLIPLITLPYLVRTIGIEKFGLVNFSLSLCLYFGAVIQFGFGVTATREIARHRDDLFLISKIYSATITASICLALACIAVASIVILFFNKFNTHLHLYFFSLLFVVFQSLFPIWFFQGMERMKYITFLSLSTNIIFLTSLFLFVKNQDDYVLVPLLNAGAALTTFFLSVILIKKQFKVVYSTPKINELRSIFTEGRHAFISQLAPNFYNNSTVFLLGIFTNNTTVGLYTAAIKVVDSAISLGYILSNTFLPYLSRNMDKHDFFRKIMIASGSLLTLLIFIFADLIALFLFSGDNIEIALYIRWLAVCIFLVFSTLIFGPNYLMLIGQDHVTKNIALYTSICFFIFALLAISSFGIWGAIATLLGARMTIALLQYIYFLKLSRLGHLK